MKSFRFRLERVLSWRGTQLALAEAKAEQLKGGLLAAGQAKIQVVARQAAAQTTALSVPAISGADLVALESARIWTAREEKRLAAQMVEMQRSIEEQNRRVAEARRGVKLVERLKERKLEAWQVEADRELDELSAESAIAQWRRLHE